MPVKFCFYRKFPPRFPHSPSLLLALTLILVSIAIPAQGLAQTKTTGDLTNPQTFSAKSKNAKSKQAHATAPILDAKLIEQIGKLPPETQQDLKTLYEAVHREDRAIGNELQDDEQAAASDILMLWQAAVERSGTIRYAIEKFSRRDATGKPVAADSFTKRLIESMAHLGGVAGTMMTGTPAGLIGSQMVNDLVHGDPSVSALSRVTDADMLILAKEIEALQSQVIDRYYNYRNTKEQWKISKEAAEALDKYYQRFDFQENPSVKLNKVTSQLLALQPIVESLYQDTKQEELNNKQAFLSAQAALGMLVGNDALAALEKSRQQTVQAATQTKH